MKRYNVFLLCSLLLLFFIACRKTIHDRRSRVTVSPDSREYFGCRVNGQGFVSEARTNNVSGTCIYVPLTNNSAYTFQIFSNRFWADCKSGTVGITLDSVNIEEGKTYTLGTPGRGKNYGSYFFVTGCNQDRVELYTSDNDDTPGKITIKKYDPVKKVITGTFYFTVKGTHGEFFQITGGIFDRHYTEG